MVVVARFGSSCTHAFPIAVSARNSTQGCNSPWSYQLMMRYALLLAVRWSVSEKQCVVCCQPAAVCPTSRSLSGCKSCEVVRLFVSCGKHQLRRIRCHVKKKHVRKKKHVCHDCTCLVHCAIMIWTDEQGSHEINRIIVKAVFKQQLWRSIFTSALSSCVIVSVVCLH